MFRVAGEGAELRSTWPLAWIAITAIAVVMLSAAVRLLLTFGQASSLSDTLQALAQDDQRSAISSLDEVFRAFDRIDALDALTPALVVVAAGSLALWARCVASNARTRGVETVSVNKATFWWLLPIFGPPKAIYQLRNAVLGLGYSSKHLARWVLAGFAFLLIGIPVLLVGGTSISLTNDAPATLRALRRWNVTRTIDLVFLVAYGVQAIVAIRHADQAVSRI